MKTIFKIFTFIFIMHSSVFGVVVTLDSSQTFQTIEGLGAAAASHMLVEHNNQQVINALANDLGLSMFRIYPSPAFEPENDNNDPNVMDWSKVDYVGRREDGNIVLDQFQIIQKFAAAGEMPRIILSVFTPAAWMKTNNSEIGGRLRHDMVDEFAEFYSAYIQAIRSRTGARVYAISPENEPRWEQWYDSCVYSFAEMREIIKVLGRRFENDGIDVKIFAAEDLMGEDWMEWKQPWVDYYEAIAADEESLGYLDAIAVHTYEDGVAPSSPAARVWQELLTAAEAVDKPVWMTETSGYDDSWAGQKGALAYARSIFSALKYGNCSAWVWLNAVMNRSFNPQEGLIIKEEDGQYNFTQKYYVSKQYYRYIRPGAVRFHSQSDDGSVLSLAFTHAGDGSTTILLINQNGAEKEVALTGMQLPEFKVYQSTYQLKCEDVGTCSGQLTLPGRSITTLHDAGMSLGAGQPGNVTLAQNYPNPFNPDTEFQYAIQQDDFVSFKIYNILGERVRVLVSEPQDAGEYTVAWDGRDQGGRPMGAGTYFYEVRAGNDFEVRKMVLLH